MNGKLVGKTSLYDHENGYKLTHRNTRIKRDMQNVLACFNLPSIRVQEVRINQ